MMRSLLLACALGALLSTTAAAQNYSGYLDLADCNQIAGWGWDSTQPNTPINVDIYDGTTFVATVPASNFRQDLYNAGYGNGNHGYSFATPASLKNNQYHYIYVKYGGTSLLLNNSDTPLYCTATSTGYKYYYSDTFPSINSAAWSQTGGLSIGAGGLTNPSTNDTGSLISKAAVPGGNTRYEVKATLALKHTSGSGGGYDMYLNASADALYPAYGTFYVVTVQDPTPTGNGSYSATLSLYKRVNGLIGFLTSTSLTVHDASVLRAVHTGSGQIIVYSDNSIALYAVDTTISSGQPGVGLRNVPLVNGVSVNGISRTDLGPLDIISPTAINAQQISTSPFPTRVDIHSPGTVDDPNGTGIAFYQLWRNGAFLLSYPTMNFTDLSVSAGNTYSYILIAFDYHLNNTQTGFTVVTPPANAIDPREVGVRPTGSYWGGAGEKIDMRSGNLNYTIPLIKAMARSGWSASFNLSYNSQNWRQDPANVWQLGEEVGYGYGWRLQAGSIMPVYKDYYTLDHYVFMDATGAEYRLDTNNGSGVWTSKEGIYISFDSNTGRLYFTDGSFWTFGSTSAATEQDAGVMYPTLMEDTNGNQVAINYNAGGGLASSNSSSRIQTIQDLRGSYTFTYNYLNTIPRLANITNNIGTAEKYTLNFGNSSALVSPWNPQNPQSNFGTINLLGGITATGPDLTTTFAYDASAAQYWGTNAGTGELIRVTTPYGGHLRWDYQANTLAGSRAFREVQTRSILLTSTGTETGISIYRDGGDTNRSVHLYANFFDWSGGSNKVWWFQTDTSQFNAALPTAYEERNYPSGTALFHQDFTWAQTTPTGGNAANPYISSTLTKLDPGQTYQAQKKATETVDQYGNLTDILVYDFGNLSTPVRTYHNTYLTSSNYTSRYMFNRLRTSTVTDGTNTTTLSQIYYDGEPGSCGGFTFTDPSTQPAPMGMHDTSYGITFGYRGVPGTIVTPASTVCNNFDVGGNVTSSSTNGVTTTNTTASGSDYAFPTTMTTGSLSNNMSYTSFLGPSTATGPNGESASISYDSSARPATTNSPFGVHTDFVYNDTQSPPITIATTSSPFTNSHWVRTTKDGFGRTIKAETGSGTGSSTATALSAAKLDDLLEAGVFDEWEIANASGSKFEITLSADWYLILAGNGFIQVNPAAVDRAVKGGAEAWVLTVGAIAAIYDWWRHYSSATSWMAGSFPTVRELQTKCTPVGEPVIVPATKRGNRQGGMSVEQEYLCPDGKPYTVHTLVDKNGNIIDQHVRPGGPRYGRTPQ